MAPYWVRYLDMAESWSTPPWEICGGAKVLWILRHKFYGEAKASATKTPPSKSRGRR